MRKRKIKITAITLLSIFLVSTVSLAFYFHMCQADDLRQQTAFFTVFESCVKRLPHDKTYESFSNPASIPCFQEALTAGPDESFKYTLAALFVRQGRYDEARPLFVEIAHPDAFGLLFRRERTAAARHMLLPGAMQEARAAMFRSEQAEQDLVTLSTKNNAEEQEFLRLHADVNGGMITRMSDVDKGQWLQMRARHAAEAAVLYKIRNGS